MEIFAHEYIPIDFKFYTPLIVYTVRILCLVNNIVLTKTTVTQNQVMLSYHTVHRLYFQAVVFEATIVWNILFKAGCPSCHSFNISQTIHPPIEIF